MAETLRIATWNADLTRRGPGLLLQDLRRENMPQIEAFMAVLRELDADILLLTGVDYDTRQLALVALVDRLAAAGLSYPYHYARPPNAGLPTGLDLDRNGRLNQARDAMGYGRFQGQGGMALLSRLPIVTDAAQDYTDFLWADLPGALLPPDMTEVERAMQRLSSVNHWQVPVRLPNGQNMAVMGYAATPPVFDGPEDRNGRRNHDESAFWLRLMEGALPYPPPAPPFVLLGNANLDPEDGDGRPGAILALLQGAHVQDTAPRGSHGRAEPAHRGDPALDTALFTNGAGGLRVDYVLPSTGLRVTDSGILWPAPGPMAETLAQASNHAPVWVEIDLP